MSNMSPEKIINAARTGDVESISNFFFSATPAQIKSVLVMRATNNDTLLHIAAEHGHHAIVHELITRGADVNAIGDLGETALHRAAYYAYLPIIQKLLANGANYSTTRYDGEMAIHVAAMMDCVDAVDALVKQDPSQITALGREGGTAFIRAALSQSFNTMEYLLSHGDDANQKNNMTKISAIQVAFIKGQNDLVSFLQKHGAVKRDDHK